MSWTSIPASVYAVGKPITSVSYGYLKDNIEAHDHVSGRGAQIPQGGIASGAVGQGELKTATATQNAVLLSGAGNPFILPGGSYTLDWTLVGATPGRADNLRYVGYVGDSTDFGIVTIVNGGGSTETCYINSRYIQNSPPYKIGNQKWGHFVYILINSQDDIIASYEAEDPPYAYHGPEHNAKDSVERIMAVPHPFIKYWDRDPALDGLEIVLIDLRGHDTKKWKDDNAKNGKGILEDLGHINKKGKIVTPQELGIDDIQGFTDKVKIRKHN